MKTTWTFLNRLYEKDYIVNGTEYARKTLSKPIPYGTGVRYFHNGKRHIPDYLDGFEDYYECPKGTYDMYFLKREYWENRPHYEITIEYLVYDVDLTDEGKKRIKDRYNHYSKIANRYKKVMSEM